MPVPIGEVGAYAGSGGVIVLVAMKLLPLLFKKTNGGHNGNGKPGKATECIERGKKMVKYDAAIRQLCINMNKYEKTAETARLENNAAHEKIFDKLDALR